MAFIFSYFSFFRLKMFRKYKTDKLNGCLKCQGDDIVAKKAENNKNNNGKIKILGIEGTMILIGVA